jgi:hypothetical protein
MTHSNPLLQKYNELYGKKEEPKPDYYKGEKSYAEELEELRDTSTIPVGKIKSYDLDDLKVSFQQIAEKVKNDEAQVSSMSMEMDIMYGTKITFEVYVNDY